MPDTDLELLDLQAEALFVHDAAGRLLRVNEPNPTDPAPYFFLGRSRDGNLWRTRSDLPAALAAELARLAAAEPATGDRVAPRGEAEYCALLRQHAPNVHTDNGLAYWLPAAEPPPPHVLMLTADQLAVVDAYFPWLRVEMAGCAPVALVVMDGVAVAAGFSSRVTARACEAGVYTVEAYRGRGCAVAVMRAWAAAVRASGRLALYSTGWTNLASQAVARKLGAVPYGTDFSIFSR